MRLIDADKFKQVIAALTIRDHLPASKCNAMCKLIDNQPTAYDIEKVLKQIDEISELVRPVGWSTKEEIVRTKDVLNIIRSGEKNN